MSEIDLSKKRITVTGASGFLGQHVVEELKKQGATHIFIPSHRDNNLLDKNKCKSIAEKSDIIIHLAAAVGGIGANRENPGSFFYDNLMMGVQLIEEARKAGVEKFVALGTVCAYPKFTPVPFKESDIWNGYPEETNAPYGLAKKMLLVQLGAYKQQYGFNGIYLLPVNLYGPCFSEDTEVFTPNGIKNIKDLKIGEEIYSLNPETNELEIDKIIDTQVNKTDEWFNFKGRSVDFRVTPDHKIYYRTSKNFNKRRADYFRKRAGKKYGQITFAHHKIKKEFSDKKYFSLEKYLDKNHVVSKDKRFVRDHLHSHSKKFPLIYNYLDFAEFLGWYISEGSISTTQISKGGKQSFKDLNIGQLRISQSKKMNLKNYNLMKKLFFRLKVPFGFDDFSFFMSSRLFRNFIEKEIGVGSAKKSIPSFVFNKKTSFEFRKKLFESLMLGDGNSNERRFTTKSERLANQIIHLAFLVGKKPSVKYFDGNCFRVYFRVKRKNTTVKYKDISIDKVKEQYSYCVTTNKNHIIYAGRNGKFNWIGQCDNFDPKSSHVIPALIRKIAEAKKQGKNEIEVWGTGSASREFLYVKDAAKAIVDATKKYNKTDPVNLGSGKEIKIKDLVELIAKLMDYKGKVVWNKDKPDGQPRRCLDTSKAKEEFGFVAETDFEEGLKETIKWFIENEEY